MGSNLRIRTHHPGAGVAFLAKHVNYLGQVVETYNTYTILRNWYSADYLHSGPPYREGGPLALKKSEVTYTPTGTFDLLSYKTNGIPWHWIGSVVITPDSFPVAGPAGWYSFDPVNLAPDSRLNTAYYGPLGWNRFRPGNAGSSVGQFIGELHQLPVIPFKKLFTSGKMTSMRDRHRDFVNLGDEYLNLAFGWLPFLSDLRSMYLTYTNLQQTLDQLYRDNGKPVRREGTISVDEPEMLTITNSGLRYHTPTMPGNQFRNASSSFASTYKQRTRYWFSARFRYWIPPQQIHDSYYERIRILKLFGVNPSPALLWELMPWSWLIDWFSNIGTVLDNMTTGAAENLAADYAFVMGSSERVWEATNSFYLGNSITNGGSDLTASPFTTSWKSTEVYKKRSPASPFGFGFKLADFSLYQLAILTALGISRVHVGSTEEFWSSRNSFLRDPSSQYRLL